MSRHAGIGIDDDGITAVVVQQGLVGAPAPTAFAPCGAGDADGLALTVQRLLTGLGWGEGELTVAVPAGWSRRRVVELRGALARVGLDGRFVSRPEAALRTAAPTQRRRAGSVVVVDIGGLGTEISTVETGPEPRVTGVAPADLGTGELDWVVLGHVLDELVGTLPAHLDRAALADRCRAARQELTLSDAAEVEVPVVGGTERVRITRAQFEDGVYEPVTDLVARVARALDDHRSGGVRLVVVTGDGADLPLLNRALSTRLAARRWVAPGPAAVATGAAYLAADRARVAAQRPAPAPAPTSPASTTVRTAVMTAAAAVTTLVGGALAQGL
jgi:molecular chaperone DnaK (HSP70)